MNDTSKYLHRFLETTLLKEMDVPAFSFSEKSANIIKTLYTHLLESNQAWQMCLKQIHPERRVEHLSPILFSPEMFSGINYNYIPKEIRAGLEHKKHGYQTTFYFPGRTIHIFMVFPKNPKNTGSKTKRECMLYIRKIFMWLYIAEKYASNKCSRVLNLYFYMTNHLKTLPDVVQEPIHMVHVNTAFTLPCSEINYMYLFRSEEWFKVFIHETFHNFGIDFSTMDQKSAEKRILSRFPLSISDIRIFESYCETWAQTINLLFISYWSESKPLYLTQATSKRYSQLNKTKKDIKKESKKALSTNPSFSKIRLKMESLLGKERLFSVFQCIKVLNHFDLTYDDIYKTEQHPANTLKIRNYQEKTNVFSYYVLKTILFYHLNAFLEWCIENNENVLNFRKTEGTLTKYVKLIEGLYADPEYTLLFEKMTEWYEQKMAGGYDQSERSPYHFAFKTLRMTSSESA